MNQVLSLLSNMPPLQVALMATVLYYSTLIIYSTIAQLARGNNNNTHNNNNTAARKNAPPVGDSQQQQQQQYEYDVIIIGAGIVGCTLGGSLAKQGKSVLLIERDVNEPDRIVGELLQPGGVHALEQLEFDDCLEDIDSPYIEGYGVFYQGEKVHLPYPPKNNKDNGHNKSESSKVEEQRHHGRSFHYGRFIMNLRRKAQSFPGLKLVQGSVTTLLTSSSTNSNGNNGNNNSNGGNEVVYGVQYHEAATRENKQVTGALVVVANGAGSTLTRSVNQGKTIIASCFVGLRLKNAAHLLPYVNHGNVFMVDPAPVLCYPVSSTDVRVLIDFPGSHAPNLTDDKCSQYLIEQICPSLPQSLHEPFIQTVRSGQVKCALNREMPADLEMKKRGVIVLGDALNTRHPLTGGGMTVSFGDVLTLSQLLEGVSDLSDYDAVDQAMRILSQKRKRYASTINILANALYAIFAPGDDDPMRSYMKKSVFSYFKLGGICATGPVSLLSGITQSYHVLLTHFFSVAIVGCFYECFNPLPTPRAIWTSIKLLKSASFIVGPLIAEEKCLPFLFPRSIFNRDSVPAENK